ELRPWQRLPSCLFRNPTFKNRIRPSRSVMLKVSWPWRSYLLDEVRVTADVARRMVCADRPDARGNTDRHLRAVACLPCHSAWRVCRTSRTAHDRQRPERVSGVVSDHERVVAVRSQVAIRPY